MVAATGKNHSRTAEGLRSVLAIGMPPAGSINRAMPAAVRVSSSRTASFPQKTPAKADNC
jgi:hypothetical protein